MNERGWMGGSAVGLVSEPVEDFGHPGCAERSFPGQVEHLDPVSPDRGVGRDRQTNAGRRCRSRAHDTHDPELPRRRRRLTVVRGHPHHRAALVDPFDAADHRMLRLAQQVDAHGGVGHSGGSGGLALDRRRDDAVLDQGEVPVRVGDARRHPSLDARGDGQERLGGDGLEPELNDLAASGDVDLDGESAKPIRHEALALEPDREVDRACLVGGGLDERRGAIDPGRRAAG